MKGALHHARRSPFRTLLQILSIATVVVLGGVILSSKVMAQSPRRPTNLTAPRPSSSAPASSAASAASAAVSASAGAAPAPPADEPKKRKEGDAKEPSPVDDAVTPPGGGVPIHPEGAYRSPFANPKFGGPCNIRVGFLLNHIRNFDIKEGTYDAEFYLSYTSDKPMPPMDPDFTNGKIDDKEVVADTPTFKLYHFRGEFSSMPDLRNYPFDKQDLEIEIEENQNGNDQVNLIPDREHSNLDAGFDMPGWLVEDFEGRILNHHYPDRFDHDDLYYGRYHFILGIRRFATNAVFSVFVPAFVIVLISLIGLWLPRAELEVRSNASAPMLAAAVIFHFTLNQALPATPYLTRADKLMSGVYVALIINMVATWLWFLFDEKHEETIFKLGKYVVPPLTIAIMVLSSVL
jgi:hypothetical protein